MFKIVFQVTKMFFNGLFQLTRITLKIILIIKIKKIQELKIDKYSSQCLYELHFNVSGVM